MVGSARAIAEAWTEDTGSNTCRGDIHRFLFFSIEFHIQKTESRNGQGINKYILSLFKNQLPAPLEICKKSKFDVKNRFLKQKASGNSTKIEICHKTDFDCSAHKNQS
jgi:hypothetical protein